MSNEVKLSEYIGRQIKIVGDHPWADHLAQIKGFDHIGMLVSIKRNDAMDGHECYITKREHYKAIPKGLETR